MRGLRVGQYPWGDEYEGGLEDVVGGVAGSLGTVSSRLVTVLLDIPGQGRLGGGSSGLVFGSDGWACGIFAIGPLGVRAFVGVGGGGGS